MTQELSLDALRVYDMLSAEVWFSRLEVQLGNRWGTLKVGNALRELVEAGLVDLRYGRWGHGGGSGRRFHSYRKRIVEGKAA